MCICFCFAGPMVFFQRPSFSAAPPGGVEADLPGGGRGSGEAGGGRRWWCDGCGRAYAHQPSLCRHKKQCPARDAVCTMCAVRFPTQHLCREHMKDAHGRVV